MAKFFDNVSGKQKLILIFGGFAAVLGALVFVPTEAGSLLTWISEFIGSIFQAIREFGGSL